MGASAKRDGCPAEYRWRPLFNAAKFGWRRLLECPAVMLPWRKICWNLQGCPKLVNWSQPLVGQSSPYCEDMWRRYCCLTSFFPIVDTWLSCEDIARQSCAMVVNFWRFFASCIFNVSDWWLCSGEAGEWLMIVIRWGRWVTDDCAQVRQVSDWWLWSGETGEWLIIVLRWGSVCALSVVTESWACRSISRSEWSRSSSLWWRPEANDWRHQTGNECC